MPVRGVLIAVLAFALSGCGGSEEPAATRSPAVLDVALDFTPNANHAPLYQAVADGADRRRGVRIRIRPPGEGPDGLKLLAAGRVDVAIIDINDLALARENGADAVGFAALVQRPLAALVGRAGLRRPRDLDGQTVGVSGLPSDPAFLKAIVRADGGDYDSIRQVTIGFNAVGSLLADKVDAVPVFWNAEGVALRERGRRTSEFRVERYGAPAYPEVVFIAREGDLGPRAADLRAFSGAIADGIRSVTADPARATKLVAAAAGQADPGLIRAQLDATLPLFSPPVRLDRSVLRGWANFATRIGLVGRRPDVERSFAFGLSGEG